MTDPAISGAVILSRTDWADTQPTAPTEADRMASDTVIRWIRESDSTKYDYETDGMPGSIQGSLVHNDNAPVTGAMSGLVLTDLRGKHYYDPMWDLLLDQLDYNNTEEIERCLFEAAYQTGAINSIGKPKSTEHDGPQGLTLTDQSGYNWIEGTCGYPSTPVMAAAWSKELMYEFGFMVGQEALLTGIGGWYAPGLNIHRSPFGGRAAEYFSEDGVLSGYLGAQVISGAGEAGLYCAVKHFVLVDTEAHRNPHTSAWLTEQALREVYLKPFEIALKTARKTIYFVAEEDGTLKSRTMRAGDFIIAGDSAVGPSWTAANLGLLTQVVRGEWGFQGFIISDMHLNGNGNQVDIMLRSGCDALMSTGYGEKLYPLDYASPTGQYLLRNAIKNICYTQVNSNLMQGAAPGSIIEYAMSPWQVWLIVGDIAVGLLLAAAGCWIGIREWDEKRYPENYEDC